MASHQVAEVEIVLLILIMVSSIFMAIAIYASRYKRVPPNKALVVFGRRSRPSAKEEFLVILSGGRFIQPIIESFGFVTLEPFTADVALPGPRPRGLRVVARVPREKAALRRAATQFLDKPVDDIRGIAASIIEGHALGLLNRFPSISDGELAERIPAAVGPDLEKVGLEVVGPVVVLPKPT